MAMLMIKVKIKKYQEKTQGKIGDHQNEESSVDHQDLPKELRIVIDHLIQNVVGDISKGVTIRNSLIKVYKCMIFFQN